MLLCPNPPSFIYLVAALSAATGVAVALAVDFFWSPALDWTPKTLARTTKEMPPRMLLAVRISDVSTLKPPGPSRGCTTCANGNAPRQPQPCDAM